MDIIKFIKEYGTRVAVVVTAVALLLFIPAGLAKSTLLSVFLIVLIVLLLAAAVALLFLSKKEHLGDVHYFLYHPETRRTMSRSSLNERMLRERVSLYLSAFGRTPLSLWDEIPHDLCVELRVEPQFRPVIAYSMLLALSDCKEEQIVAVFELADAEAVSYVCKSLSDAEDGELAAYLYDLKKHKSGNSSFVTPFFKKNAPRFSARALHYIQKNFDEFYVERSRFVK